MEKDSDKPDSALSEKSSISDLYDAIEKSGNSLLATKMHASLEEINRSLIDPSDPSYPSWRSLHSAHGRQQRFETAKSLLGDDGEYKTIGDIIHRDLPGHLDALGPRRSMGPVLLGKLHDFLSERGMTPQWPSPAKKQGFASTAETQLVAQITPETSVGEFCALLEHLSAKRPFHMQHQKEFQQLENELTARGCKNVRDLLRIPSGKTAGMDISPYCKKVYGDILHSVDQAFEASGKDIYK